MKKHKQKFQCELCQFGFRFKGELVAHVKSAHKQILPDTTSSSSTTTATTTTSSSSSSSNTTLTLNNKLMNKPLYDVRIPRLTLDKNALKCKYCDIYGSYQNLKIHHVNSHKNRIFVAYKYKCGKCDTYYTKLGDVKEHMTNKHYKCDHYVSIFSGDTREYKCGTCGAEYANLLFLKLHISNKARCTKARILRNNGDNDFVDALQSDFVTYLSTQRAPSQINNTNNNNSSSSGPATTSTVTPLPTARKSTTLTRDLSNNNNVKRKINNINTITIASDLDGVEKTMSVNEFSNIYNIYPKVIVNDCKNDIKKTTSVFTNV